MKLLLSFCAFVLLVFVTIGLHAQTKVDVGRGQVQVQVGGQGRIVDKKVTELRRFPAPVTTVPATRPPNHPGYSWHWHQSYGWVAFPVAQAPATVVLAPTYQLPAQVTYYEVQQPQVQTTCPHCGQLITISVAK